jgi:hypothetical protein
MLQLIAQFVCATGHAGNVITHMGDGRRPLLEREHAVERSYAVSLGRRDIQPLGDVIESAFADPANTTVKGVQRGQEQMPLRVGFMGSTDGHAAVRFRTAFSALPA